MLSHLVLEIAHHQLMNSEVPVPYSPVQSYLKHNYSGSLCVVKFCSEMLKQFKYFPQSDHREYQSGYFVFSTVWCDSLFSRKGNVTVSVPSVHGSTLKVGCHLGYSDTLTIYIQVIWISSTLSNIWVWPRCDHVYRVYKLAITFFLERCFV